TGGYLHQMIADETSGPNQGVGNAPARASLPTALTTTYDYSSMPGGFLTIGYAGIPTAVEEPRGIRTEHLINELTQIFLTRIATIPTNDGAPMLGYEHRFFYDANNQLARKEIQHDVNPGRFTMYAYDYDLLDNLTMQTVHTGGANGDEELATQFCYDN